MEAHLSRRDDEPHGEVTPLLSDAARALLTQARKESEQLSHEYLGTEHIVLALTGQPAEFAILPMLGVDHSGVRSLILERLTPGTKTPTGEARNVNYTERTKQALAAAVESARAAGSTHVRVPDVIVGLLRERKSFGAQILQHCGLGEERVLELVHRLGTSSVF